MPDPAPPPADESPVKRARALSEFLKTFRDELGRIEDCPSEGSFGMDEDWTQYYYDTIDE
jgi:hypothetical protein